MQYSAQDDSLIFGRVPRFARLGGLGGCPYVFSRFLLC
jgi:hypothetical protein